MGVPGLFLLGLGAWGLYQASKSSSAPTMSTATASNGAQVGIRGLVVPPGLALSSADVAVARYIIDTSVVRVFDDGTASQTPTAARGRQYLDLSGLSAGERLKALQYGVNLMAQAPQEGMSLFNAIGGF